MLAKATGHVMVPYCPPAEDAPDAVPFVIIMIPVNIVPVMFMLAPVVTGELELVVGNAIVGV